MSTSVCKQYIAICIYLTVKRKGRTISYPPFNVQYDYCVFTGRCYYTAAAVKIPRSVAVTVALETVAVQPGVVVPCNALIAA